MSRGERTLGWGGGGGGSELENEGGGKEFKVHVRLPTEWFSPSTSTGVEHCSLEARRKTVNWECWTGTQETYSCLPA